MFKNFLQCVVIHTVKDFSIVNEAEIDAFLEPSCFFHDPVDVGHLIMEKAREFQKNIYFCFLDYAKAFDCVDHSKLWKILSITLLACEMSAIVQ